MEHGLVLRQNLFGVTSNEYQESCKLIIESYNYLAMVLLKNYMNHNTPKRCSSKQKQNNEQDLPKTPVTSNKSNNKRNNDISDDNDTSDDKILKLLLKAQKLLALTEQQYHHAKSKAITYNNLACYYKEKNKLHCALKYLKVCLKLESMHDITECSSDSYLNTCVVLSKLNKHHQALEHALNALSLLEEELLLSSTSTISCNHMNDIHHSMVSEHIPIRLDRIIVLTITYYNIGVEQEYLKLWKESMQSYKKGMCIAYRYLGGNHCMYATLNSSFENVMKINKVMSRSISVPNINL